MLVWWLVGIILLSLIVVLLVGYFFLERKKEHMMFIDDRRDLEDPNVMRSEQLWPLSIIENLELEHNIPTTVRRDHNVSDF